MTITVLVEGKTEQAFKPILRTFLEKQLGQNMPRLDFFPYQGRIPKGDELKRKVETSLSGSRPSDHVIALTDVYTGAADFSDAEDAKKKMRAWVGNETRFSPHVALHDFEAWLLPYWPDIQRLAGHNRRAPAQNPETVNHAKPPARHISELFITGKRGRHYNKVRDAASILRGKDLGAAISKCAELKSFVNTIIRLSGGTEIV
ncbi:MAG TPA: DUF4276 family protein [Armatimonadota bacterium]|nr:DUF4276 family protein [Armatimonadota bacterium]